MAFLTLISCQGAGTGAVVGAVAVGAEPAVAAVTGKPPMRRSGRVLPVQWLILGGTAE